jgi:hypothetical protein
MRAKLLKKLRKRFYWYRDKRRSCWYFYDLKENVVTYASITSMRDVNDMLILSMLRKINLGHLYKSRRSILEEKAKNKEALKLRKTFSVYFKSK